MCRIHVQSTAKKRRILGLLENLAGKFGLLVPQPTRLSSEHSAVLEALVWDRDKGCCPGKDRAGSKQAEVVSIRSSRPERLRARLRRPGGSACRERRSWIVRRGCGPSRPTPAGG